MPVCARKLGAGGLLAVGQRKLSFWLRWNNEMLVGTFSQMTLVRKSCYDSDLPQT
jgi:hypothetical protein